MDSLSEAPPPSVPGSGFNKLSPLTGCSRSPCTPTSLPGSTCPHRTWRVTVSPVTEEGHLSGNGCQTHPKEMTTDRGGLLQFGGRPKSRSLHLSQSHQRAAPDTESARRPGSQHTTASARKAPGHLALTLADTSALTLTTRYSSPGTARSSEHKKCRTYRGGTAAWRAPRPDSALLLWVGGRHLGGGEPGPPGSSQSQTIATACTLHLPSHKSGKVWPYRWKTTSPRAPHQLGFAFHNPTAESALLSVL